MSTYDLIYKTVRQIPAGKVATYGQIADLTGIYGKARLVGYAMFQVDTTSDDIPWHRVINAKGEISYSNLREGGDHLQKQLLEQEGVEFNSAGKVNLSKYQWEPDI
ncbi:MAG: MGMT family protein [Cyanobacteriota bacterium]|nr:MGMT family protein [Cyanobacteriota bacterium]